MLGIICTTFKGIIITCAFRPGFLSLSLSLALRHLMSDFALSAFVNRVLLPLLSWSVAVWIVI